MRRITDSAEEDQIGEIMRQQIFAAWRAGKPPVEIAEEMRISIRDVYKILKQEQKAFVQGWS